jgi:DNA-directed RNA polymerase subunit RPC12/RpoP
MILQESLNKGKAIEIPSLGIRIEPQNMGKSCLFPMSNYRWKCAKCEEEVTGHVEDSSPDELSPPNCPKCGVAMEGRPIICRGPEDEGLLKKY